MILTENKKIKLFAGAAKVKAAYMGAVKVYPNASLEVSPSLVFAAAGGAADLSILVEEGQAWSIAGLPAGWSASATSGTGPASVSISAPNNTSTGAMNGLLTVSSDDLSATCSLAQAAGKIVYGNWQNVSLLIDTTAFPASGGSSRVVMEVRRDWTWNGVAGSGSYEMSTASLYSPLSSDGVATFNGNNVLVASLGVAFKAAATITISAVTEHDSTRKSASITQAANYVT
ncbi:hypothetical protein, partial [uncultured Rikenella sp.]|uniref:hypothetical protein n=1 Tax=uncultured Rikenella sp. TaxID=368003 RepID=UPI00260E84D5